MFLAISLQQSCYNAQFQTPQEENTQKNVYVSMSERGVWRYTEQQINEAFQTLVNDDLGGQLIDLGIIVLQVEHMRVIELKTPASRLGLRLDLDKAESLLTGLQLTLVFEFKLQYNAYPYTRDSGTGRLYLNTSYFGYLLSTIQDQQCPGQLQFLIENITSHIANMQIVFYSGLGRLYNAIVPLLEDYVTEMSNTMIEALLISVNKQMRKLPTAGKISQQSILLYDQRIIGNASIIDRQFYVALSGVACIQQSPEAVCSEGSRNRAPERSIIAINSDITYEISKNVFNSAFQHIWELDSGYIQESIGIEEVDLKINRIAHTGIVTQIKYVRNGTARAFEAIGQIKCQLLKQDIASVASFAISMQKITRLENEDLDTATRISQLFEPLLDKYAFALSGSAGVSFEHATVIYVDNNWVIVGASLMQNDLLQA